MEKNIKTIKIDILDKFREISSEVGATLPVGWLLGDYLAPMNRYEKRAFKKAVNELVLKGLIEYTPGILPRVTLTRKGEQLIVP